MNNEVLELTQEYRNTIFSVSLTKGRQPIEFSQWGAGEYKIDYDIKNRYGDNIVLYIPFLTFATLEKALVFTKFCDKQRVKIQQTLVGYLSYGRQERETDNEPKLIDPLSFNVYRELCNPTIIEPHSKECARVHFEQPYWTAPLFKKEKGNENKVVVAPDKGAKARLSNVGVKVKVVIDKSRHKGSVTSFIESDELARSVSNTEDYYGTFMILDDICDGGRTFTNVAELLKNKYPKAKVELYVAHAILPFGVESLKGKIDKIVALDTCFPVGTYFDGFLEVRSSIDAYF